MAAFVLASFKPPDVSDTVDAFAERRNRGYDDCVRRAPAIANRLRPPVKPSNSATPT